MLLSSTDHELILCRLRSVKRPPGFRCGQRIRYCRVMHFHERPLKWRSTSRRVEPFHHRMRCHSIVY